MQSTNQAIQDFLGSYDLWLNRQLKCPTSCVVTHGLSLNAFSLQSIYLSITFSFELRALSFELFLGGPMLIHDGSYSWEGFGGKLKLASGRCRLRIYDLTRDASRKLAHLRPVVVIVSDVPGCRISVRSCAGHVATSVARDFKIEPLRMMFIEYYPESVYGEHQEHVIPEKYEAVDFNWTAGGAIQPRWRTLQPPLLDAIRQIVARGKSSE